MKKALVFILSILIAGVAYANEAYELGKKAYQSNLYGQAKEYFSVALKQKPKNMTYRYYYANSLMQLGMIDEAAEQYQMIALSAPNSNEGILSVRALKTLNKYFEGKAGEFKLPDETLENYIATLIAENKTLKKWDKNQINVYIPQSESYSIVQKAFLTWSEKLHETLKFNFVPTAELADITVNIVDKLPLINPDGEEAKGFTKVKYDAKNIISATITIQDKDVQTNEVFNPELIYLTSLHQIGHAIGINSHSDNPKDLMNLKLTELNKNISYRDINTVKMLYKMTPSNVQEIKGNPLFYSVKLNEAKEYVEVYPKLPTAWSSLASAYVSLGDYEKAVDSIQKAIELKKDDPILYAQLAGYYWKLEKYDLSIQNYKTAYDLYPDNKVYLYNWAKACYKNKQPELARPYVDEYLNGQGFLANDEISRLLRRMYKQDKEKTKQKIKETREQKERKIEEIQELEQGIY